MTKRLIKIFLCILVLISSSFSQPLNSRIASVLSDSLLSVSQISLAAYDLTNDEVLFEKNSNLLFRPASNMKLLTTSAALMYLSEDDNFETKFLYTGVIKDSTLKGSLIAKGGFDPMFSKMDLDSVINSLKTRGIKKITGSLIADVSNIDSLYFGKGWMWDDNPYKFMPYLSSLNIDKNSLKIFYAPGEIKNKAQITFDSPIRFFSVINNSITTIEDTSNLKIERDWLNNNNHISISGDISYREKRDSTFVNIVDPPKYFLNLLSEKFELNDIDFNGEIKVTREQSTGDSILTIKRNILDVINETNRDSDNLGAEMLLRKIGAEKFSGTASAEKGLKYIDSLAVLLGYSPETFVFADGSGLSHYNLVSTSLIIDLLKYFYKEQPELYGHLYESLPIAGVDGTLEHRMRFGETFKNVRAKTGTISGVSNLSGYLTSANNHLIAFSIFIQNYSGSAKRARQIQDEICRILSEYK